MIQIKYWLYASILLALMLTGAASHAHTHAIDLAPLESGQDFVSSMHVVKEQPDTALNLADIVNANDWQPATPGNVSSVLRASTIWLTEAITNNSPEPITRWIKVGYWRLADVQMFLLDPSTGQLQSHMQGGLKHPPSSRPLILPTMDSVFPIELQPGQRTQIVLRIQSGGWRTVTIESWSPSNYVDTLQQTRMMHSTLGGVALTSIFLLLLTRRRLFVLLATWLAITVTGSSFNLGYGIPMLSAWLPGSALSALIATLATWDFILLLLITAVIFDLYKSTLWRRVLLCVLAVGLTCSLLFFFIDTLWLRRIIAVSLVAVLAIWPPMLWAIRHRAWREHRLMVVLLGLEWVSLALRMVAYNTSWLIDYDRSIYLANIYAQVIILLLIIGQATLYQQRQLRRLQRREQYFERNQREQLEALVIKRTTQLERSMLTAEEATKAKTEFLSHVSHDLRSPLATIMGYTRLLQSTTQAAGSAKQLDVISRTANHMLSVIDDLVDYTRNSGKQYLTPEPVYTTWLVDIITRQASALAEANNNHFVLRLEGELPSVIVADSRRLQRILMNLLDNAAKFTHNGRIELHIHCQRSPEPNHVSMRFIVRDTGCGIHPDDQAKLFEPFFRGRSHHGSSGLGLGMRIVSTWVKHMHGTLHVKSQPDQGTEITIELSFPLGDERDVRQSSHASLPPSQLKGEGRTLWVVEDVPEIRQYLTDWLNRHDFVVLQSSDGVAFIETMQETDCAPPSAVLTDYYMPGAGGDAVLDATRRRWPGVPVLLLSAHIAERTTSDQLPEQRFDAMLSKPIDFTLLAEALSRLLYLDSDTRDPSPQDVPPTAEDVHHDNTSTNASQQPSHRQPVLTSTVAAQNARPPEAALTVLARLVGNGALTDIDEWAQTLRIKSPEHAQFALEVERLAEELNMPALSKLIAQSK